MSASAPIPEAPAASVLSRVFTPQGELRGAITAGILLILGFIFSREFVSGPGTPLALFGVTLQWLSLAIGMVFGLRAAAGAIIERKVDIDVLMVVGAGLAAAMGAPGEGALLLFLFVLAGALEDLAMERTRRAVEALHRLMPTAAIRWQPAPPPGTWQEVAPESLQPGDRVRILPGEIIPADAAVAPAATPGSDLAGSSSRSAAVRTSINQASITGESMPREVRDGDELFAGTINVGNPIEAIVSRPAAQSSLQRILNLVTQAQQQREPVQRMIDRLSEPYALGVFAASIGLMLFFRFALNIPWLGTPGGGGSDGSIYAAITLLIVASPCALIISTPTATLAGISRAARGGVLFKGGQSIERLALLAGGGAIAFDKTGTLTIGRPRLMKIEPVGGSDSGELLALAAALEAHSTHPIAEAIVESARSRGVAPAEVDSVGYTAGRGVSGISNGLPVRLGSLRHVEDLLPESLKQSVRALLDTVQHRGHIAVVCVRGAAPTHSGTNGTSPAPGQTLAGVFVLSDAARPGAECLVERLHALGVRPVVMLTGDNQATATRVATDLGLDAFHAQLLPEQKVEHVARLKAVGDGSARRTVGVIGDGVNDAPALAAADVAIAIGSIGSDAALESADIVLLSDDLSAVPWAVRLAQRVRRTVKINLAFSLGAIAIMAICVLLGPWIGYRLPLWLGVLGHEGGTILVVAHSLLLLAHPGVELCTCDKSAHAHAPAHTPLTISAGEA